MFVWSTSFTFVKIAGVGNCELGVGEITQMRSDRGYCLSEHRLRSTSDSSRCRATGWNHLYGSGETDDCRQGECDARTLSVCIREMVRTQRSPLKMYSTRDVVNRPMVRRDFLFDDLCRGGSDFFANRRLIQSVSTRPFAERYNSDTSRLPEHKLR